MVADMKTEGSYLESYLQASTLDDYMNSTSMIENSKLPTVFSKWTLISGSGPEWQLPNYEADDQFVNDLFWFLEIF